MSVYGTVPGANGAQWATTLWLRNESDDPLDVFPVSPSCLGSTICFVTMRSYSAFHGRETGHNAPFVEAWGLGRFTAPGRFLYVERARANQLTAQLHVADMTRNALRPTKLPVVRESEFFNDTQSITGVPIPDRGRLGIRIYDLDSRPASQVIVRFWDALPIAVGANFVFRSFGEVPVTLSYDPAADQCGFVFGCPEGIAYRSGYGEIANLLDLVPSLRDASRGVRIEIVPMTEGLRYWPLVTITDDETNFVSIFAVR